MLTNEMIYSRINSTKKTTYTLRRHQDSRGFYVIDNTGEQITGVMNYSEAECDMKRYNIEKDCVEGYFHHINKVDLLLALVSKYGVAYHDYIIEQINTAYKG